MFQRYQQARHGDGDMATMSFYDYRAMVEDTPIETLIAEFRDADDRLVGACLTDRLGDGLTVVGAVSLTDAEVDGGAAAPQLTGLRPAQAPVWSATAGCWDCSPTCSSS